MEIGIGTVLKDRYRVDRLLGRGGMASVWRGHDPVLDRSVAVKVLSEAIASDPDFVARFRREATVAAGLTHPNLVRIYDYAEADERPYLVMEFVPGEDLSRLIESGSPVDRDRLATQVLSALAHIHRAGIVHRDVKPHNVLIERDGNAKLIDFGIALPPNATALTSTGLILATKSYAAPEVMRGDGASERSDLFSCGVVLDACGGAGSAALESLVSRLTREDPAARPASAAAALDELEDQIERRHPSALSRPIEPPEPTAAITPILSGDRNRRRWAVSLGLLAVLIAVAVVVFSSLGGGEGRSSAPTAQRNSGAAAAGQRSGGVAKAAEPPASTAPPGEAAAEPAGGAAPAGEDPALASSLNEEGYELIQAGSYEAAIPVLEESVRAFPAGTDDVNYAYALFNLGDALRRGGHPEEAIPILEQRLRIPNQTEVVERELAAARSEALGVGEDSGD